MIRFRKDCQRPGNVQNLRAWKADDANPARGGLTRTYF